MKAFRRTLPLLILVLVAVGPAEALGGTSCHTINATGIGQDLGGGMTTAHIIGGGLLHGTTDAAFVITGFSGTVATFEGTIVFTVNNATLTAGLTGTFDLASGVFHGSTTSIAGTGKLAGATGSLSLDGVEDFSDGTFTENVTGGICVDLAPS